MRSREIFRGLVGRECGGHEPKRHSGWRRFSSLNRGLIERVATVPRAQAACCRAGVQMAAEGGYRRRLRQPTSHSRCRADSPCRRGSRRWAARERRRTRHSSSGRRLTAARFACVARRECCHVS
jgi:hypothetical protein